MIELSDVTFRWRPEDDLILDIPKFSLVNGESIFISGPSGSGKSTLLNLLGGVLTPQTGSIKLEGQDLTRMSARDRDILRADHLGLIFQIFNLMPFLSIIENVTLPCQFSEKRRLRAEEKGGSVIAEAHRLLNHMGLAPEKFGNRTVSQLSIGQQQRVAASRALLGGPKIIIADEPTSALDMDARLAFLDLLFSEAQNAGTTLVFVSHDQSLASRFERSISLADVNLASGRE